MGRARILTSQHRTRATFPYTFPLDFDSTESRRVIVHGRVRLSNFRIPTHITSRPWAIEFGVSFG